MMLLLFHAVIIAASLLLPSSAMASSILQIHGSGTTNPSKCYWNVMDVFMTRSSVPSRITYRAVGSGIGMREMVDVISRSSAAEDVVYGSAFTSGDFPFDSAMLADMGGTPLVQLPVLAGAVSFFHSVPGVERLNLSPCLLARIFSLEITDWSDAEILKDNTELERELKGGNLPIRVAVRASGSSSSLAITNYLSLACNEHWDNPELVDSSPNWSLLDDENQMKLNYVTSSGGMINEISNNEGTIGYIDSGHGVLEGLKEIELNNGFRFLNSQEAVAQDGVAKAVQRSDFPERADMDLGDLNFLNRDSSEYVWPIVLMTYIYVPKDLSKLLPSKLEKGYFFAFLEALYDEAYVGVCRDEY
jgi:ABC-type phosphate transport system substrate-binding protein